MRKRGSGKEPKASVRVTRLEEKLDSLVSLMRANPQAPAAGLADSSTNSPESYITTPKSASTHTSNAASDGVNNGRLDGRANGSNDRRPFPADPNGPGQMCSDVAQSNGRLPNFNSSMIPVEEAEQCLETFRANMLDSYPIMVIPDISASALKAQRPFLWLAIMVVTTKSTLKQRCLGMEIRAKIAERLIVEGERDLDLLMGLLVCVAWSQYYIFNGKPITTNICALALAVLADLGLNKPILREVCVVLAEFDSKGCPGRTVANTRTLEERRAALAAFSVSQLVTTYFSKLEPLRWTPYLDECLRVLSTSEEASSDRRLVHIVRLQAVVSKTSEAPWQDESSKTPVLYYINALNAQLEQYHADLPEDMRENGQ